MASEIQDMTGQLSNNLATGIAKKVVERSILRLDSSDTTEITKIGRYAFAGCKQLSTAAFPECSIIDQYAFADCEQLLTAVFSKCSVIKNFAFRNCVSLSNLNAPICSVVEITNPSYLSYDDATEVYPALLGGAFSRITSATGVSLKLYGYFGTQAFAGCTNLERIQFPKMLAIPSYLFAVPYNGGGPYASVGNLYVSYAMLYQPFKTAFFQSVRTICTGAFFNNHCLEQITASECQYIMSHAFRYCWSLKTCIFSSCKSIGVRAFYSCPMLKSIIFPECETIEEQAFQSCSSLFSVYFSKAQFVGADAFAECYELTTVNLPNAKIISDGAFRNCSNVTSLRIDACEHLGACIFGYGFLASDGIFYAGYPNYNITELNLPKCLSIESGAFEALINLRQINIPAVKVIPSGFFAELYPSVRYYPALEIINCNTCSIIYETAFIGNQVIKHVNAEACMYVGSEAFCRCHALTTFNVSTCNRIENSAFYDCNALMLDGNFNCTYIGKDAFYSCYCIGPDITLNNCSYIGASAFAYCSSLQTVRIGYAGSALWSRNSANPFPSTTRIYVPENLYEDYTFSGALSYVTSTSRFQVYGGE